MAKDSVTQVIKRSQITLNPYNPKRHTDEQVKLQKKNIKANGFLGGIVWNKLTGNLIDGHRRVKALDLIHKYDGTPETDYEVKVEVVEMDEKTEKNQMVYMAVGNSKADYNLIALYAPDIDYADVGLTADQYEEILNLRQSENVESIPAWEDDFIAPVTELDVTEKSNDEVQEEIENRPKMTKEQVKAEKKKCADIASDRHQSQDLYIILNFKDGEQKQAFCDLMGIRNEAYLNLSGEPIYRLLEMIG